MAKRRAKKKKTHAKDPSLAARLPAMLLVGVVGVILGLWLASSPASPASPPPTSATATDTAATTTQTKTVPAMHAYAERMAELLIARGESTLTLEDLDLRPVPDLPRPPTSAAESPAEWAGWVAGLLDRRQPGVLRQADLGPEWAAGVLRGWTVDDMADDAGVLSNVLANSTTGTRFYYVDNLKPILADVPGVSWVQPYQVLESVPASAFLSEHADKTPDDIPFGHHMYMSRSASDLLPGLAASIAPFGSVLPDDAGPVKVWLSSPGVTAHLHHDNSDNLFVQVKGRKRFILVSPEAWDDMYMFSALHPATRQSQVDIEALDVAKFPRVLRAIGLANPPEPLPASFVPRGFVVTLEPGDMLWVPAYTFHHVSALDMSVSVMSFISSRHKEIVKEATFGKPLPLSVSPKSRQLLTLWTWLAMVIDAVEVKPTVEVSGPLSLNRVVQSGAAFVGQIINTRYAHLDVDPMLINATAVAPPAPGSPLRYCKGVSRSSFLLKGDLEGLLAQAQAVGGELNKLDPGVRDIALAYYVESVTNHFVPTEDVATFFAQCFVRPMER